MKLALVCIIVAVVSLILWVLFRERDRRVNLSLFLTAFSTLLAVVLAACSWFGPEQEAEAGSAGESVIAENHMGDGVGAVGTVEGDLIVMSNSGEQRDEEPGTSPVRITKTESFAYSEANRYLRDDSYFSPTTDNELYRFGADTLVFFKNDSGRDARITDGQLILHAVEPIEQAEIFLSGWYDNGRLKVYAVNNGWGDAQNITAQLRFQLDELGMGEREVDASGFLLAEGDPAGLKYKSHGAATILRVLDIAIDEDALEEYLLAIQNIYIIGVTSHEGQVSENEIGKFYYDQNAGGLRFMPPEVGAGGDNVYIVKWIDVDNPQSPMFLFDDIEHPTIAGVESMCITLVPSKSAAVTYSLEFEVDGEFVITTPVCTEGMWMPAYISYPVLFWTSAQYLFENDIRQCDPGSPEYAQISYDSRELVPEPGAFAVQ